MARCRSPYRPREEPRLNGTSEFATVTLAARMTEFWYLIKARIALWAGRRERARASLKGALRRNPGSFVAHFMLGRIYWRDHSPVKAKREFDLAWQIDPERFERTYARLRAQHEGVPELFRYATPGDEGVQIKAGAANSGAAAEEQVVGDFMNKAERARFSEMPPITRDEIMRIDWDRLQDEICRDR